MADIAYVGYFFHSEGDFGGLKGSYASPNIIYLSELQFPR